MSLDGKATFVYGLADGSNRIVDTQNIRAEDPESAMRLLRAGGFLEDDNGEALHATLLRQEG